MKVPVSFHPAMSPEVSWGNLSAFISHFIPIRLRCGDDDCITTLLAAVIPEVSWGNLSAFISHFIPIRLRCGDDDCITTLLAAVITWTWDQYPFILPWFQRWVEVTSQHSSHTSSLSGSGVEMMIALPPCWLLWSPSPGINLYHYQQACLNSIGQTCQPIRKLSLNNIDFNHNCFN